MAAQGHGPTAVPAARETLAEAAPVLKWRSGKCKKAPDALHCEHGSHPYRSVLTGSIGTNRQGMNMHSATVCFHGFCIALLLLVLGGPSLDLSAQVHRPEPPTNSRVRITAPEVRPEPIIGTIVEKRPEAWIVGFDNPDAEPLEVPLTTVNRLEVSRGLQRNISRGLGFGALAGSVVGVLMGLSMGDDDCSQERESGSFCLEVMSAGDKAALFGFTFGLLGGAIGAVSGLSPSEKWEEAGLPRGDLGLSLPGHGGVAAVLTVRF